MAASAVSFLLQQLYVVLRDEGHLLGDLKQEVQSINDELVFLKEFLKVADEKEESDPSLKEWVRQLREISFDVQDVLEDYMHRFGRHRAINVFRHSINKALNLNARHDIAYEIKALKLRLDSVVKSQQKYRDMYGIIGQSSSSEEYDGRGDALFLQDDEVVGIEEPKKQLLGWIRSKDSGHEVISVVGTGGMGKTTLVKKVYDDEFVKKYFDRHIWVTVSDYKDNVKDILVNLIKRLVEEIKESPPQGLHEMSIDDMRNYVYEFLKENKYIIVLDDVWKLETWEVIRWALPRTDSHGCIIITTRNIMIGDATCSETDHLYNLQALSTEKSEELFFRKAFPKDRSCPRNLRGYAEDILRRCGGLPLAIVVIGGLLGTKRNNIQGWEQLSRSLSHDLQSGNPERLWKVLFSLSYNDLPYYLKYCFLYLSIFPQSGFNKDNAIDLWIAEGFVQRENDKNLEEVGDELMNELYCRNLIQVSKKYGNGTPLAFRIHDLLRDYISSKSREHNIATVHAGGEKVWPNKIRRLIIQNPIMLSVESTNFGHLRSLKLPDAGVAVGKIKEILRRCKLLKVLDLEGAPIEVIPDEVFKLYHLKYLSLTRTMVKLIPKTIKHLENLQMLNLAYTNVTKVPAEITELRRLRHLVVGTYGDYTYARTSKLSFDDIVHSCRAPYDIGSCLQSLQTLNCVDGSTKMVREIGMLTNLSLLSIAKVRSEDGKVLCSSIANLTKLQVLAIYSIEEDEKLELNYSLSSTSLQSLTSLVLNGCLEKVPQWIPTLQGLSSLSLRWCKVREDPLNSLQDLPNLTFLEIHGACVEGLSFRAGGFQKLQTLDLCEVRMMKWVIVEKGSMPDLQRWIILGCELLAELPLGIEHLTNLQHLDFRDMPSEYIKRVVEEQRDNQKHAPHFKLNFYTLTDGSWSCVI